MRFYSWIAHESEVSRMAVAWKDMITLEARRRQAADGWAGLGLSKGGLTRFVREAQRAVGLVGEVGVLLADDKTLRRLNREFRGKDKATDVLSFPSAKEFGEDYAGDLAISVDTAARQASEHGHSLRVEVRVLLLHGLLHLSGMDHETDRGEMAAKEAELRETLRLPNGLIARVEGVPPGKAKSRFPAGMTTRTAKARAKTQAGSTAKAKAGSLSDSSREIRVASEKGTAAKKRGRR
jgi:probable rRNA maturation factor